MSLHPIKSTRRFNRSAAAAALFAAALAAMPARGGTIDFSGRTWNTLDGAHRYTGSGSTGTMTGRFAVDAVINTALTLNVGDRVSYDYTLTNDWKDLTNDGSFSDWIGDAYASFRSGTDFYDSRVSGDTGYYWYRDLWFSNPAGGGWVNAGTTSNVTGVHFEWTVTSATTYEVKAWNGKGVNTGTPVATYSSTLSDVSAIQSFRLGLWDSEQVSTISDFKKRPTLLPASGVTRTWDGASGDYNTAVNWSDDAKPTLADDAKIDNGGTATVSSAGANSGRAVNLDVSNGTLNVGTGGELFAANIIRIGSAGGTGTVNQTGGVVAVDINSGADLRIGFDAGATGHYNLNGGELWVADSLAVGQNGTGTMTMTGGWISHAGFFTVGNNPGANGTFTMTGGRVDQTFGDFEVGDEAVGVANISGGTFNTAPGWWFSIGNRALGTGTATISGTAVVNAGSMIVGRNATNSSTLNVNGGTVNVADDWFVGLEGPGQMSMTAGTVNVADDFVVGHKTSGTVTIGGGTVAQVGWIVIGDEPTGTGTLNVTGGTINQSFGDLEVGDAGNGTYNQSGGTVNIAGNVFVANQPGSTGDANVSGGTLTANRIISKSANSVDISGTGTVNIRTNGTADGMSIVKAISISDNGVLNLNDNDLIVDYAPGDPSPEFALRDKVKAFADSQAPGGPAFAGGISYTPGAGDVTIAIAEKTEWGQSTFNGVTIDDTTVIGKYTYYGDANLDGKVDSNDYVAVDVGLGNGNSWVQGDFNFSGTVTSDDYVAIDTNLGKGVTNGDPLAIAELKAEMVALHTAQFGDAYAQALAIAEEFGYAALVPEPGSLSVLTLGAAGLLGRRRRKTAVFA